LWSAFPTGLDSNPVGRMTKQLERGITISDIINITQLPLPFFQRFHLVLKDAYISRPEKKALTKNKKN
jgi:hypothetical protein